MPHYFMTIFARILHSMLSLVESFGCFLCPTKKTLEDCLSYCSLPEPVPLSYADPVYGHGSLYKCGSTCHSNNIICQGT